MDLASDASRKSVRVLVKEIYRKDHAKIKKLLLGGANVNGKDYDGNTPLHHAVVSGDIIIVRLILEHGGNVNAANASDFHPFDLALNNNFTEALLELLIKNDTVITQVPKSIDQLPRHIADLFYNKVDLEMRNVEGRTALHVATANNDIRAVRQLLARNDVNVNVRTTYKEESPLHLVVSRKMAKLLLNHGASIDASDRYASTPLCEIAVKRRKKQLTEHEQSRIIELLIKRGADLVYVFVLGELHLDFVGDFDAMHGFKHVLKFAALTGHALTSSERSCCNEMNRFYRQLLVEVSQLKDATFYCNVSFHKFLVDSWQGRLKFIDDLRVATKVKDSVVVDDLAKMFPLYSVILRRHVDAANERNALRQRAALAIMHSCPQLNALHVVVNKIVRHLSIKDIQKMFRLS